MDFEKRRQEIRIIDEDQKELKIITTKDMLRGIWPSMIGREGKGKEMYIFDLDCFL